MRDRCYFYHYRQFSLQREADILQKYNWFHIKLLCQYYSSTNLHNSSTFSRNISFLWKSRILHSQINIQALFISVWMMFKYDNKFLFTKPITLFLCTKNMKCWLNLWLTMQYSSKSIKSSLNPIIEIIKI